VDKDNEERPENTACIVFMRNCTEPGVEGVTRGDWRRQKSMDGADSCNQLYDNYL